MKRFLWFACLLLLFGCDGETALDEMASSETAVPSLPPPTEEAAEVEVAPTNTAVSVQPTNTRPPATVPPTAQPPTRRPTHVPATPAPDVPALVWLPYATGDFGQPVLMMADETVTTQPMPVEIEIYFDYKAGWLAYGGYFWEPTADQQSVTNLHLYNFATGEDEMWAEQVGRAALTPLVMLDGPPSVAAAIHNGQEFDLVLVRGAENRTVLVEDVDPYFSWSPDGSQIAYLRDGDLFVTGSPTDSGNAPIASGVYAGSGWIGDAPLWLGDSGYLLYADAPFTIVAADGSETIVTTAADDTPLQGPRPFAMLYSPTTNQLIAESEGMFGSSVLIYQLSDGFKTAVPVQEIEDAQLAGWYEPNKSVLIVRGGEPAILPLTRLD